jgi:hypothetical protein
MSKPKRTTFEIALRGGARAERKGFVLGGFATHKEPGPGVYFYSFTHLDTGTAINVWPCHETQASAIAHLAKLADGSAPQCAYLEATLAKYGRAWGLGQ